MSTQKLARWFVLAIMAVTSLSLWVIPAYARPNSRLERSTCLKCHEDLYYLYDIGKWYCVSEAGARCVDCHGGNPATMDKTSSHTDLVAYPVMNGDATKCKECHPQDYDAHVRKFDQIAGLNPMVHVAVAYTPAPISATDSAAVQIPVTRTNSPYNLEVGGAAALILLAGGVRWFFFKSRKQSKP